MASHRGPHAGHPGTWPPGLSILWPPCPTFDPRNSVEKKPCIPLNYLQVVYKMGWLRLRLMLSLDFGGFRLRPSMCDVKKNLEVSRTLEPVMRSHDFSSFFVHPNMSRVEQHDSAGSFENGWDWLLWVWVLGVLEEGRLMVGPSTADDISLTYSIKFYVSFQPG